MNVGSNVYVRPTAIGSTAGGDASTTAVEQDEGQDQDEEYIDPMEEIKQMRFNKYMSAFDVDLEALEVVF